MTTDFVVAVFVVWQRQVLLHLHPKLGLILPPGGHIESNELPDEAARRETLEETGVQIELIGELAPHSLESGAPTPLVRPRGVQLETIGADHQHLDLIYFAKPLEPFDGVVLEPFFWLSDLAHPALSQEIRLWCKLALSEL